MKTRESEEMYLETILLLTRRGGTVRSIDIAFELGYAKSSVSRAVNLLIKKEYVEMDGGGALTLTQKGNDRATEIYERHEVITSLLIHLGADEHTAEENACRMEHVISKDMFNVIKSFLQKNQ